MDLILVYEVFLPFFNVEFFMDFFRNIFYFIFLWSFACTSWQYIYFLVFTTFVIYYSFKQKIIAIQNQTIQLKSSTKFFSFLATLIEIIIDKVKVKLTAIVDLSNMKSVFIFKMPSSSFKLMNASN